MLEGEPAHLSINLLQGVNTVKKFSDTIQYSACTDTEMRLVQLENLLS